ncbi:hypothetical protein RND71_032746 [Anisodus tanguticus]|uniref:Uncharacterized protein n=1 Tax=Anisodus tanguticus TaxID=243964 RepID=A0AAE1R926_9SOLA|nr:hypothetical protein RND71_032746 [Anisodus tanguticus]
MAKDRIPSAAVFPGFAPDYFTGITQTSWRNFWAQHILYAINILVGVLSLDSRASLKKNLSVSRVVQPQNPSRVGKKSVLFGKTELDKERRVLDRNNGHSWAGGFEGPPPQFAAPKRDLDLNIPFEQTKTLMKNVRSWYKMLYVIASVSRREEKLLDSGVEHVIRWVFRYLTHATMIEYSTSVDILFSLLVSPLVVRYISESVEK